MSISRRSFIIGTTAAATFATLPSLNLPPVTAAETIPDPNTIRFTPEIEPLVKLIEDTPRNRSVEVLAHQLTKGTTYTQFLAALFLAGIRNVNPQPPGFSFHCVFMIHSCNYLAKMAPPNERYLPLFLALDDFKKAQAYDLGRDEGDFQLKETIGTLPTDQLAWQELHTAMENWDEPRADRAITKIARTFTPEQVFENLWEYGARDYRNIGHKIIFTAHAHRTLQEIGWQHAEPTLRSLMLGLLDFGATEIVNNYAFEDQGYLQNRERAKAEINALPKDWTQPDHNHAITMELLDAMREGKIHGASELAIQHLQKGNCKANTIWDAVHLAASELMMRQQGIAGVHTITSSNAMRYAFRTTRNPRTRLLLILQATAWMAQFRNFMPTEKDTDHRITDLQPTDLPKSEKKATETILQSISANRHTAAQQTYTYHTQNKDPQTLINQFRHLTIQKMREHHQIKWSAAIFEDYTLINPQYRPHLLAASTYYLRGQGHPDSPVTQRAINKLKKA